jgi:hypothetical protein
VERWSQWKDRRQRRLLGQLRAAFPDAVFRVRLDGGFASAKLFAFLEREQVEYVVAMASNVRLEKRAGRLMGQMPRIRSAGKASVKSEASWDLPILNRVRARREVTLIYAGCRQESTWMSICNEPLATN